jgi:hypothetical protein
VLGQQVLMARMEFPVSVLAALNSSDTSPAAQAAGAAAVTDYLTAKATPAALRTPAQAALMNPALNPIAGLQPRRLGRLSRCARDAAGHGVAARQEAGVAGRGHAQRLAQPASRSRDWPTRRWPA